MEDISDRSRDLIFELVRSKADDLLAGMDFINMEPTSMRRQAHSYADDLINYLRVKSFNICFFFFVFVMSVVQVTNWLLSCSCCHVVCVTVTSVCSGEGSAVVILVVS